MRHHGGQGGTALLAAALLAGALVQPLAAQRVEPPRAQLAPFGGVSVTEGSSGVRIGDVVSYGLRVVVPVAGYQPFLEGMAFSRPDLDCNPGLACNDAGWAVRVGALATVAERAFSPGLKPRLLVGFGVTSADVTEFSYLFGGGVEWRLGRILAPFADLRWERLPGLTQITLAAGVRFDVP